MEWCVDTRVVGAAAAAEEEIAAHLSRHSLIRGAAQLARPGLLEALEAQPSGVLWVSIDWEGPEPLLAVYAKLGAPMTGRLIAPGLARCQGQPEVWAAYFASVQPTTLHLAVRRAPERDLDPEPRKGPGVPLSLADIIAEEVATGRPMEEAAARAGATAAARLAAGSDLRTVGPEDIARVFIDAERQLGGDFFLVSANDRRAVLGNRRCPFGPSARPEMCRFTSALAGGLGARRAGRSEVTLDERLALGDAQCRLTLDLGPPSGRSTSHQYSWPPAGLSYPDDEPISARGFRLTMSLQLPRDRLSVPVTRHLISGALREVGVVTEDVGDVELAVSEACTNVITHSSPGDAYEVTVTIAPSACHIRVVDVGHGFDHRALTPEMAGLDAEHGRGVALMHALVDKVHFESQSEVGTVVHLVKDLHFDDNLASWRPMLTSIGREDQ